MSNEWNVRATNSNGNGCRIRKYTILSDLIRIDSVLSSFSFQLVAVHPQFYFRNAILHTLDRGVQMVWMARIKKLSVVSKN